MGLRTVSSGSGKLCLFALGYGSPPAWGNFYYSAEKEFESGAGGFVCKKSGTYLVCASSGGYGSWVSRAVSILVNGEAKASNAQYFYWGSQVHETFALKEGDTVNVSLTKEGSREGATLLIFSI